MHSFEDGKNPSQSDNSGQHLLIGAQLLKVIANMHHIDEVFQWLASTVVQRFQVHVAEIWALHRAGGTEQLSMQLRALVSQDASLPQYIVTNNQVGGLVERLFRERHSAYFVPVNTLFSAYQASLFGRYGLNYCSSHSLSGNLLLPPSASSRGGVPAPLTISLLLFMRHLPPQNAASAINSLLEGTIQVAGGSGLLLPMAGKDSRAAGASAAASGEQRMAMLIPRRREEKALLMSNNPFARSVDIDDGQARRLYQAIDGRKNVRELASACGMTFRDTISALQKLLVQRRVELFEPGGRPVANLRPDNQE